MHTSRELFGRWIILSVSAVVTLVGVARVSSAQEATPPAAEAAGEAGANTPPAQLDGEKMLKDAEEAMAKGDFETGLKIYDQLSRAGEQKAELQQFLPLFYTGRGRALAGLKEYEAAEDDFKKVIDANPASVPTLVARGMMYLDMGAPDKALSDLKDAVKNDRANMQALFGLGKSYIQLGGFDQGIPPLTRVVEADPKNAEAFRLRGTGYLGTYKSDLALADLKQSIDLSPDESETYAILAMVYLRDEDYENAIEQISKAIEHYKPKPGHEDEPYLQAYLQRSSSHIELGKKAKTDAEKKASYQAAVDDCEALLEQLNPKSPYTAQARAAVLHSRGVGERMLGELGKAIKSFSEAIELNPELGESYFRRGICFHLLGEDKMAISDFAQAAKIGYDDPRASLWEGFLYAKVNDYHEAVRAYGDAIAVSDRYSPAYINRALAYMMLGEHKKAIKDFNEAIRLEPANGDYYFKRGVAYQQLGDFDKAANSFASAIEFDTKNEAAYRHMAEVTQRQGRNELANQYRQKAADLAPSRSKAQPQ